MSVISRAVKQQIALNFFTALLLVAMTLFAVGDSLLQFTEVNLTEFDEQIEPTSISTTSYNLKGTTHSKALDCLSARVFSGHYPVRDHDDCCFQCVMTCNAAASALNPSSNIITACFVFRDKYLLAETALAQPSQDVPIPPPRI